MDGATVPLTKDASASPSSAFPASTFPSFEGNEQFHEHFLQAAPAHFHCGLGPGVPWENWMNPVLHKHRQPNRNHGGGSADAEARRRQELPEGGERSPFFALALRCMLIGTAAEHTPLCAIRDRSWRCTTAARSRRMARCAGVVRSGGVLAWMRAGTCAHCESCLHGSMRARARCWPHQEFDSSYKRNKPFRFTIGVGQVGLAAPREAAWPLNLFARVPRRCTLTPSLRAGHQGMG